MRQTKLIMGMPISVEIIGGTKLDATDIFDWFHQVDARYSTYKPTSEISRINDGLPKNQWSDEMKMVLDLCEQTKRETNGYFDIERGGRFDPSGLVKGWALQTAAYMLQDRGFTDFYLEAGGDIQVHGHSKVGTSWRLGIRNPFNRDEIVKVLALGHNEAVATSGTYIRGQHIYDPHHPDRALTAVKSLTVIGSNIYDADRFATAAFAMGIKGLQFIESLPGFEGYLIDDKQVATHTSGFERYVA